MWIQDYVALLFVTQLLSMYNFARDNKYYKDKFSYMRKIFIPSTKYKHYNAWHDNNINCTSGYGITTKMYSWRPLYSLACINKTACNVAQWPMIDRVIAIPALHMPALTKVVIYIYVPMP